MADYTNSKFYELNSSNTLDGNSFISYVERIGLDFGDDLNYKFITGITPHFVGEGTVSISVGTENFQGEGVLWSQPVPFNINEDYEAHFRETGRYIAVKFESSDEEVWALTGYTIEYTSNGER